MQAKLFFRKKILQWHRLSNTRSLPWKNEKDPYRIWLSETMLQQTKAATVVPYYERFVQQYPSVKHLAAADEQAVLKLWEGLGYYRRCANMLYAARQIMQVHKGVFPSDYKSVLALKGVGTYTAAAISSFALHLPYAVLDGNVYRVLARFFGIQQAIDSKEGKAYFETLSTSLLDKKNTLLTTKPSWILVLLCVCPLVQGVRRASCRKGVLLIKKIW